MKKILFVLLTALLFTGCGEKKAVEEPTCNSITGGSYTLNFVTNTDQQIESKSVCIACPPDSYEALPTFDGLEGWYYDAEFTKKVEASSTIDINPVPIYDAKDKKCVVGYKNITLYAKIG